MHPSDRPLDPLLDPLLDNPVWHALTGRQSALGDPRNGPLACRYDHEVAPFAALPDEPTAEAWDALRDLVGPGNVAVLFRDEVAEPQGWERLETMPGIQMLAGGPVDALEIETVELGPADVDDMLDLVERTKPGPFARRTVELGTYLGVHDGGRLVAMAGERMRPTGCTELSAICVEASHRRRGLAAALVQRLVAASEARGERAFLHVVADNHGAIATYEALGFATRRAIEVAVLAAPR